MIQSLLKILNTIHGNALLYALFLALTMPFLIIAVGYCLNLLALAFAEMLSWFIDPWWVNVIINYFLFPGVMIHELSHATLALITGAKVTEMKLFKKQGDSLGHVNIKHRGSPLLRAIQCIFIAAAPMFIGVIVVYGTFFAAFHFSGLHIALKIFLIYIGISMFFNMTMSKQDIKVYFGGIPVFMVMIFILSLIMRFFKVI